MFKILLFSCIFIIEVNQHCYRSVGINLTQKYNMDSAGNYCFINIVPENLFGVKSSIPGMHSIHGCMRLETRFYTIRTYGMYVHN